MEYGVWTTKSDCIICDHLLRFVFFSCLRHQLLYVSVVNL
ncbi:unnamed protein product [Brassica rapa subsp. trilocularis]